MLVIVLLVAFVLQSEVVVDEVNEDDVKDRGIVVNVVDQDEPMMLTILQTSDGFKLVVAIDDVDVDPSCPTIFSGTIVDDCSTGDRDVVVYLIYHDLCCFSSCCCDFPR